MKRVKCARNDEKVYYLKKLSSKIATAWKGFHNGMNINKRQLS